MMPLGVILFGTGVGFIVYTYALYPGLLKALGALRSRPGPSRDPDPWPAVSILLPAYNEEHQIAETLGSLLSLDYPKDRLQILVVSDASTDRTDEIARAYADRGVEFFRVPERKGRGAAEIAAVPHLTGDIIVNTDPSTRIGPDALKPLIRVFSDREVGLASGREVREASAADDANPGGAGSAGYEMAIRDLETRVASIVEPSGRLYAIRLHLHRIPLPASLSRDFAAALHCGERSYRAVSVPGAVCHVPRGSAPGRGYRGMVRTLTRDMRTLLHKRHLMNPFRYGLFSWVLFSHKACRWLAPWAGIAALVGLALMAPGLVWARVVLLLIALVGLVSAFVGRLASDRSPPRLLILPAAALHATLRVMVGGSDPQWTPARGVPTAGE